ncbi:MAG: hypothetical protein K0Q79_634 [Flavipsychrobacter sp.]|jgi:class 3 adenylate cyclase/Tfp pilus assembly protein PilF|nr:hypothetical protein [Flavipsychrobacter sp.]
MKYTHAIFNVILLLLLTFGNVGNIFAQDVSQSKIDSLERTMRKARHDTDRLGFLEALYLLTDRVDTARSLKYINSYLAIAQKNSKVKNIEAAYKWLGLHYFHRAHDHTKAIYWFNKAIAEASAMGDRQEKGFVHSLIAKSYKSNLEHDKALEHYRMAMQLDKRPEKLQGNLGNMGTLYLDIGDYPNAAACFEEAYNIQDKELKKKQEATVNDSLTLMGLLISIAYVDVQMSQFDKALDHYHLAHLHNNNIKNTDIDLWIFLGIGKAFQLKKEYSQAIENYEEALRLSRTVKDAASEADILNRIGNIYLETGDAGKAMNYAGQAANSSANNGVLPGTYLLLGKIYIVQNNTGKAIDNLKKAITLCNAAGNVDEEATAWAALSSAYEKGRNTAAAFDAYKHYIVLRDSVYSADKARQITSIQMQGEFNRKLADDKLVQAKKDAAAKLEMQQQKIMSYGGLVMVVMVLVVAFFIYRGYRGQKKANVSITRANEALNREKQVSEQLLLNILPPDVAIELKAKGRVKAKSFDSVTVLITDFVGFTLAGERYTPEELVAELHTCFEAFDHIISKYRIEKIKTVGDGYVAVSGLPNPNSNHAGDIVKAAIEIRDFMNERKKVYGSGSFGIRIGINSGKVVAGIVGVKKFAYDIWGDTVNTAARMEQNGSEGKINISASTYELVKDKFICSYRGEIEAKNKGKLMMYYVEAPVVQAKVQPML